MSDYGWIADLRFNTSETHKRRTFKVRLVVPIETATRAFRISISIQKLEGKAIFFCRD